MTEMNLMRQFFKYFSPSVCSNIRSIVHMCHLVLLHCSKISQGTGLTSEGKGSQEIVLYIFSTGKRSKSSITKTCRTHVDEQFLLAR